MPVGFRRGGGIDEAVRGAGGRDGGLVARPVEVDGHPGRAARAAFRILDPRAQLAGRPDRE
jgi:hypothetical protein